MSGATTTPWGAASCTRAEYGARAAAASTTVAAAVATVRSGAHSSAHSGAHIGAFALAKKTSNLFRDRDPSQAGGGARRRLDLSGFDHVITVDSQAQTVETEALVPYDALVDALLPHGCMPAVVPQLKSITAGGAVAGVGIEATSFRHGLVHDTLVEADVLLADGRVVTCRADNEHRELFFALPNSYGTLGYALRLVLRTLPVLPFVTVQHTRYGDAQAFFAALASACEDSANDFVEGVVFGASDFVLSQARFAASVAAGATPSDYGYERIYWQSLRELTSDTLSARDWLWRWDTDWFWCSRNLGADRAWVRRLLGRERLNSRTYTKLMRLNTRLGLTRALARFSGMRTIESVIQDVDLPEAEAPAFLRFLLAQIGITPIWICPIRAADPARAFTLYPMTPGVRHVNFGFWDVVRRREAHEPAHFNRLVERETMARGGIKSLYSDSHFSREEFARAYAMDRYEALKARYDPQRRLLGLYEKCVLRA
jgi:FAD/FMN-containing dehydrogenase